MESRSILPILVRRMSGDVLTMRFNSTFHFSRQFLCGNLACWDPGTPQCLNEFPPIQTSNIRGFPLRYQSAAVQMDGSRQTNLPG